MKTTVAPGILKRLAGFILLVAFGTVQMQLLPLAAAAVAAADGEHRVEFSGGRDGLWLVLRHDHSRAANVDLPSAHRHQGLVRLLAGAGESGDHPDHRLHFASASPGVKTGETELRDYSPAQSAALEVETCKTSFQQHLSEISVSAAGLWKHRWWPPAPLESAWGCVVLLI